MSDVSGILLREARLALEAVSLANTTLASSSLVTALYDWLVIVKGKSFFKK